MKKAAIIGFGRFGELLAKLASSTFEITIIESRPERVRVAQEQNYRVEPFEAVAESDFVFLAVPISGIEETLAKLTSILNERHVVIDLCSVKIYPISLMQKYLINSQIVGTHPMFGPDSAKNGLDGLQVAVCPVNVTADNLKLLKEFWTTQGISVIETTPEEHDKDGVYSQAFTYSIAKIILNMNLPGITFKTRSFNALTEVARLSANDTEQLFHDMLLYNPYFREMKTGLEAAITKTDAVLTEIETEQTDLNF